MKKIYILTLAVGLSSCFSLRQQDYSIYESFQIGNTTSQDVTLRFYQDDTPKTVYYEIQNTASPIYIPRDGGYKDESSLRADSVVKLTAGHTVLFYSKDRLWNPEMTRYSCFYECGSSDGALYIFSNRNFFLGGSVTVSSSNEEQSSLPIDQKEQWETWYDEEQFIYYHFWRIE